MDIKKILVIFLLITIYSILFWPTLNIYTHTYSNILVKINRITGESYYCYLDEWIKINYEEDSSGFKPIEFETKKDYGGGVKLLSPNNKEEKKDYGSVEILSDEFVSYEEYTGGVKFIEKK